MIGLAIAEYALVCVILHYWKAGGVKHASEMDSGHRGKTADVAGGTMKRERMDVDVRGLCLVWHRRRRQQGKVILDNVSLTFPAGEVSAILASLHKSRADQ